jgi:hypothetical protein
MARWFVLLIFGGGGLALLYVGVTQYFLQRRMVAHSRPIEVEIVKSEVFSSTSMDTDPGLSRNTSTTTHRAEIRFRYTVNGVPYESDLLRPNIIVQGHASADSAREELKPYPIGARIMAFVDPEHPDKAFLTMEEGAGPMVFIILGLLLPPIAWFVGKYV